MEAPVSRSCRKTLMPDVAFKTDHLHAFHARLGDNAKQRPGFLCCRSGMLRYCAYLGFEAVKSSWCRRLSLVLTTTSESRSCHPRRRPQHRLRAGGCDDAPSTLHGGLDRRGSFLISAIRWIGTSMPFYVGKAGTGPLTPAITVNTSEIGNQISPCAATIVNELGEVMPSPGSTTVCPAPAHHSVR
jgi:hypothetical protein